MSIYGTFRKKTKKKDDTLGQAKTLASDKIIGQDDPVPVPMGTGDAPVEEETSVIQPAEPESTTDDQGSQGTIRSRMDGLGGFGRGSGVGQDLSPIETELEGDYDAGSQTIDGEGEFGSGDDDPAVDLGDPDQDAGQDSGEEEEIDLYGDLPGMNVVGEGATGTMRDARGELTTVDYDQGLGGEEEEEEAEERTFREMLEENLMSKMMEDADASARRDAGRALAAARAQAGRGQMGMSGGMLALQSDMVTQAAADAQDRLFNQQLQAGRLGAGMETEDRNQLITAIGVAEDLGMDDDELRSFIQTVFPDIDPDTVLDIGLGTEEEEDSGDVPYIGPEDQPPGVITDGGRFEETDIPDEVYGVINALTGGLNLMGFDTASLLRLTELFFKGEIGSVEDFGAALGESYGQSATAFIMSSLGSLLEGFAEG